MENRRTLGILIAGLWLAGMFMLGVYVPGLSPEKEKMEDLPINLPKVSKPELIRDKEQALKIMSVARQVPADFDYLIKLYDQMAPFNAYSDPHLTASQVERFIIGYQAYVTEMNNFTTQTVGERSNVFRALSFAGMINNYYQVVRMRALLRVEMTGEEYNWVQDRVLEAAQFAVLSALEDGQYDSEEQKQHLEKLRDEIYPLIDAIEKDKDEVVTLRPDKYQRWEVPRGNIELFLDFYRRPNQPGINWTNVHFHRPTVITFDRESILRKAANNPP